MKLKKIVAVLFAVILIASCGQNSTKSESSMDDTTVIADTNGMNTTDPVNLPDNTNVVVPEATRLAFQAKYPTATNVNWTRYSPYEMIEWGWTGWPVLDTTAYYVTFSDNGTEYNTWFTEKNEWVGTVYHLNDEKGLPQKVVDVLNKNYSGYTVVAVSKENDKNRSAYEIKMEKGNDKAKVLIDENGNIMKKVMITGGDKTKEKNM